MTGNQEDFEHLNLTVNEVLEELTVAQLLNMVKGESDSQANSRASSPKKATGSSPFHFKGKVSSPGGVPASHTKASASSPLKEKKATGSGFSASWVTEATEQVEVKDDSCRYCGRTDRDIDALNFSGLNLVAAPTPFATPTSKNFYVVISGKRVGIFDDWFYVASLVKGVAGATWKKEATYWDAMKAFNNAPHIRLIP